MVAIATVCCKEMQRQCTASDGCSSEVKCRNRINHYNIVSDSESDNGEASVTESRHDMYRYNKATIVRCPSDEEKEDDVLQCELVTLEHSQQEVEPISELWQKRTPITYDQG